MSARAQWKRRGRVFETWRGVGGLIGAAFVAVSGAGAGATPDGATPVVARVNPALALRLAAGPVKALSPAAGSVIELRGGAEPLEGEVQGAGAAGLVVALKRAGVERTQTVPWSEVRAVRGGTLDADGARWLAAGEALWRARTRIARGDWSLADAPLEQAFNAWRGAPPSADGLLAAAFRAEALLRVGRTAEAVAPAFETLRLLRANVVPREGVTLPLRVADAALLLPPGIAPTAISPAEGVQAAKDLRALDLSADAALRAVAESYAAALQGTPRETATEARSDAATRPALAALDALRDARGTDAKTRAAGRAALAKARRTMPAWFEPWARYAIGASLANEAAEGLRDRGLVMLLSVAACNGRDEPWLAARARAESARILAAAGDPAGARRLAPLAGAGASAGESTIAPIAVALAAPTRTEEAVPRELCDATAEFLQRNALEGLVLTHLEAQLEAEVDPESRAILVARLATILAARLEREDDPADRDAMLARSMKLIGRFDEGSEPLRLVVLRSQHRAAQRAAEDRRAGRVDDAAARAAQQQFDHLVKDFTALSGRTSKARERTDREVGRSTGVTAEELAGKSAREEEIARSAQFFRAWAQYYSAWLGRDLGDAGWRARAETAMTWFAALIEPGKVAVDPSEVSVDLRSNEGFASAILGTALTASLYQTGATADAWLALLDSPGTHASVRAKLPSWRMASLLDRGDFKGSLALLAQDGDGAQGIPMALIAAARAVRSPEAPGAADLLTEAVGQLAAAGRLRDLAMIDAASAGAGTPSGAPGAGGAGATAEQGAGALLFAGVRAAAQAQRLQQAGDAAGAKEAWTRAAEALAAAAVPGAPAAVASGARSLQAWALRGAGRASEAGEAFLASARAATGERAGDAMWMAVLAFDEASRSGVGDAMAKRADDTAAEIIERLPETAGAVRARAWRVVRSATPSVKDIDALLGDRVPPELAPAARRAAFEGLYRRYRTLTGDEKSAAARRALAAGDDQPMGAGAEGTLELRRRIELALALDDRVRALDALAAVEARTENDPALARELAPELAARRVQVASLDGRLDEARLAAEAMDASTAWGRLAWQSLLAAVLRDPAASPAARAAVARAVVRAQPRPPVPETVMWARANAELARAQQPQVDGPGAAAALAAALRDAPQTPALLLADADLRGATGDAAGAAECVRAVLAMAEVPSPAWFEAKAIQIEALAQANSAQARAALAQVRQLGGGYGSGPVAARLVALEARLSGAAPSAREGVR